MAELKAKRNDNKTEDVFGLVPPVMLSNLDSEYFDAGELLTGLIRLYNAYSYVLSGDDCRVFAHLVLLAKCSYLSKRQSFLEEK